MNKSAVECKQPGCGYTWRRDPVTAVICPVCNAQVGSECSTVAPSGHRKSRAFGNTLPAWGHDERDIAAADSGAYCHPCRGAKHGRCNCKLATAGPGLELAK